VRERINATTHKLCSFINETLKLKEGKECKYYKKCPKLNYLASFSPANIKNNSMIEQELIKNTFKTLKA
jgi:hypothetical protein